MPVKERIGQVISTKRQKTVTVLVESHVQHPRYHKFMRQRKKLHARDERSEARVGDIVRVIEIRPLSKTVHWRLVEVLKRGQQMPTFAAEDEGAAAEASR
jgi:small subunit ribosomal protein S17